MTTATWKRSDDSGAHYAYTVTAQNHRGREARKTRGKEDLRKAGHVISGKAGEGHKIQDTRCNVTFYG